MLRSATSSLPARCRESLCLSRCYLVEDGIVCRLEERYPFFVAHTDSCVRPKPSHRFQFPSPMGLCRLLPAPAGRWPFPTLSLHSLCRCLDPCPGMSPLCSRPFLPEVQRPSPKVRGARPIQISLQSSFDRASKFRGCSHSLMFRPPHSLDPPAAPTAGNSSWAAGPSTPRTTRLVTCPG